MRNVIRQFKREEEGEIAVFLACYMVILILCLALTADLGNTYLTHLRMRNAVDLAATSIGVQLPAVYSDGKMDCDNLFGMADVDPDGYCSRAERRE